MSAAFKTTGAAFACLALLAPGAAAQAPRIANGTVTAHAAGSPFVPYFQRIVAARPDVAWIGYGVPALEGRIACCNDCGDGYCAACRLEGDASARVIGPVRLESTGRAIVLFRVAAARVDRIRVFSDDCELDAGGRPVEWLDNVNPLDSVALLEAIISADDPDLSQRARKGAMVALALHGGQAREKAGEALVRLARTGREAHTRGDALFWLSQMASAGAAAAITERIEQDPDTDVKKRAVFALSQLPKDEGVPLLIQVARDNRNPAVRKQAMFWLGQSKDPRAIDFFAEILK